jgi:hypothetical protein
VGRASEWERIMDIFVELFSTFTGLLSLFVILFMVGMAVFFGVWFMKNSKPPEDGSNPSEPKPPPTA